MRGRAGAHSFVHQAFDGLAWSSVVESPLQSSFASHRRPRSFEPGRLPGFRALHRDITGRVHCENGIPTPSSVPSTGVHSLSTVYSALRLRGLLHPRAASRAFVARSGGSLSTQHEELVAPRVPPCRQTPTPSSGSRDPGCQAGAPRLRGVAPRGAAFRPARCDPRQPPLPSPGSVSSGSQRPSAQPRLPGTIRS